MKKIISILSIILFAGIIPVSAQCCNRSNTDNQSTTKVTSEEPESDKLKVYYFHATRRCATCQAVEAVTKEALKEHYGDQLAFLSIDREKDSKNPLLEKYKVSGQTLLIVSGDKVKNLTNDAFLNARTNPDKFKAKLKLTIDSMK